MQGNDFACPKCGIGRFSGSEDQNTPIGLIGPVLKYQPEGRGYWIAMDGSNWLYTRHRTPGQGREVHVIAIGPERDKSHDLYRLRGTFVGDHWKLKPETEDIREVLLWLDVPIDQVSEEEAMQIPFPPIRF